MSTWGSAVWDSGVWAGGPPPGAGWGDDWSAWYQFGPGVVYDLTAMLVEARWATDSHSLGDGTYRGDIQPGSCTVRLWDPGHQLDINNGGASGSLWLLYKPTGACWCYFYDSFARGLYAPGDPTDADCVFTGSPWPTYLTNPRTQTSFPSQSVTARLNAIVASIRSILTGLPPMVGSIAGQSQAVAATVADQSGNYPNYLQAIRDAAADGVAWLSASAPAGGPGQLLLEYERWETLGIRRALPDSQIVAGPPTTAAAMWAINTVQWGATNGATGVQTALTVHDTSNINIWGTQGPGVFRLWGNVGTGAGNAEYGSALATGNQITTDYHGNPVLSSVDLQSGNRWQPDGTPAVDGWDPYTHVFRPHDIADIKDYNGQTVSYRVQKSDHRLTARVWQTTHTLEKYTAPMALPA
jgi:hypothetical protein